MSKKHEQAMEKLNRILKKKQDLLRQLEKWRKTFKTGYEGKTESSAGMPKTLEVC